MVGRKQEKVVYSAAITSVGQVTIPKPIRDALNWVDRVTIERRGDEVVLRREKTIDEVLTDIDAMRTPEQNEAIKKNAGKSVKDIKKEILESPEGRAYFEEYYGL